MKRVADLHSYALQWLVVLPLEIVAATFTIEYWTHDKHIPNAAFVIIFLLLIITINLFGVKGYGEAEFILAIVKITAIIGFIILGVIINVGGGPTRFIDPAWGFAMGWK
jgi:amino acid transporter